MNARYIRSLTGAIVMLVMSLCFSQDAMAQQHTVEGVVESKDGETLIGVNIFVKGDRSYGTTTNIDGEYSLGVSSPQDTLVFSYVGYVKKQIPINGRNSLDVVLSESSFTSEEVVVVGYGSTQKGDLTGSVSQISSESFEQVSPSANVDRMLQGEVAGLQVMNPSGEPGQSATVRIRGVSSLSGSNDPLYVVDGMPVGGAGNLKQINPQNIKSVQVLKDASAAAIYGSRGANGVILIETKEGASEGGAEINVNLQSNVSELPQKLNVFEDPVRYAIVTNESRVNAGQEPLYTGQNYLGTYYPSVQELRSGQWPHSTYWPDKNFRTANSQNMTITARGGNESTQYSFSGNYMNKQGLAIKNNYEKLSGNLKVNQEILDNLRLRSNIVLTRTNDRNSNTYYQRSPVFPVYDEQGEYFKVGPNDFYNPVAHANEVLNKNKTLDLYVTEELIWDITENLQIESQLSISYGESTTDVYEPEENTNRGNIFGGYGEVSNWEGTETINETFATYQSTFGERHEFKAMSGFTYEYSNVRTNSLVGKGFVNDNLKNENLSAAENTEVNNSRTETKLLSGLARLNYTYDERYLLTFTARADGSSKFGENNKWAFFPSGALGWKAHNESFLSGVDALSQLKIRGSYGINGNQGISSYQTLDRLGQTEYYMNGRWATGFGPGIFRWDGFYKIWGGMANPDLKWESTSQFNLGVDLALLENRLSFNADYYYKHTTDLLRRQRIPVSSGYDEVWTNDGVIDNRGFEFSFNADILRSEVQWNIGGNFTKNQNEVVDVGESGLEFTGSEIERFRATPNVIKEGEPIYAFYGYETDGIVQSRDEGLAAGLTGERAEPGEIKYVDLDNNGQIDQNDRTVIGDPHPDFTYSFSSQVYYKNFDLSVKLYGVYGNDVLNMQKFSGKYQLKRWTPDNPTNEYPKLNNTRSYLMSDWWLEDGSFLRVQNINLGYRFDSDMIRFVKSLRLFVDLQNPFVITGYQDGYDPEVGENGIHWGGYPKPRTYTFGVNITL